MFGMIDRHAPPPINPTRIQDAGAIFMAEERIVRRLAAILAADVVGYSRMMSEDEAVRLPRCRPTNPS